jgi:hypothetical protein
MNRTRGLQLYASAALAILVLASAGSAGAAEFAHYPGSFFDAAQARQMPRGGAAYVTTDRFERVIAFYGQHLTPLPAASGALFCLDRVQNPAQCRRFVELVDLTPGGVGTRILVYGGG